MSHASVAPPPIRHGIRAARAQGASRVPHSMQGRRQDGSCSHLARALRALGWTRIVLAPSGEVIEYDAPPATAGHTARSVLAEPWWPDVRAALAADHIQARGAESTVQTIDRPDQHLIVERPPVGHPIVYLLDLVPRQRMCEEAASYLTERQEEVANLLVDGLSAREIAERLHVSPATVRSHIEHVYRRLGVNNRAQAVALLLGS